MTTDVEQVTTGQTPQRAGQEPWARFPDWLERAFGPRTSAFPWAMFDEAHVRVDETVEDGTLVVRAELPGVDADEIDVRADATALHISAERREEKTSEDAQVQRREIHYGMLSRTLSLPRGAQVDLVTASYDDGVLTVRVPLDGEDGSKRVPVATEKE